MLIEFKVSNFFSIKDEVVLNLDSTSSKILANNIFQEMDYSLLKSVVIYGANASGKSNIMKAAFFACRIIKDSSNFNVDTKINVIPFLLDNKKSLEPSKFEFTFIKNNIRYCYGFSCNENGFVEEYLKYKPEGENWKSYFKRDETSKDKSNRFKFNVNPKEHEKWGSETTEKKLYLSKAVNIHNYEQFREIYNFFVNELIIVLGSYDRSWSNYTRKKLSEDSDFKDWIINVMTKTDFGGITDIRVDKQKRPVNRIEVKIEKDAVFHRQITDKEEDFYDLSFVHKDETGRDIVFKENLESTGTNKTLNILGPIYDILQNGKVLFVDEFELNLHPNITEFLIKLFHSKHNKKNGQLIITTHDTTLLKNKDLFRRDQVYICSKAPNRGTELNSLSDFDLRESLSFENAYLNGRIGGLPFIDETFFED